MPDEPDAWALPTPFGSDLRLEGGPDGLAEAAFRSDACQAHPPPPDPLREPVEAYLADPTGGLPEVPLDLPGTAFQRSVWAVLRAIPAGGTRTYGEVAARAGSPGGARAAGQAVAANPVPLVVPCHRVVPASGDLGGYSARGGPDLKARILRAEGADPPSP